MNIFWETMRWVFRAGFPFNTCGLTEAPNQPSVTGAQFLVRSVIKEAPGR